ncbi:hypothetical protein LguiB_033466 [Lonicera macranthoides]
MKETKSQSEQAQVAVIVVPFPAQGHLNQLLHLSSLVSSYNLPVHFVSTTTHSRQAKLRATTLNPLETTNIHFHEFPTQPFLSPPPNPTNSNKFPAHLQASFDASLHLREPVAALLCEIALTVRRIVVIHDPLMAFVVQDTATIPNAESYVFNCISAFALFFSKWESKGKPFKLKAEPKEVPSYEGCVTSEIVNFAIYQGEFLQNKDGDIHNTSRIVEGSYIDLLAKEEISENKKLWAIGPIIPVTCNRGTSNKRHECLEWLDKQAPKSVIYVSFGTTVSMADEEIKELAIGLEQSHEKFLWVLRDADKGDIFEGGVRRFELPEEYEERIRGVGMVVRDWAPQLEILAHPSTGGFVSHCGWNSCSEAITYGVPILTWPMHSEQPRNAVLVTDILRVGMVMKEWAQREEVVSSLTVERSVKKLMATEEGSEIRKRAEELGHAVRRSKDEGGSSSLEMDSLIAHFTR